MIQNSSALFRMVTIAAVIFLSTACSDQIDSSSQKYFFDSGVDSFSETKVKKTTITTSEVKNVSTNKKYISKAKNDINAAISDLEKIERYRKPRILQVKDENMAGMGLGKRVLVDWSGPLEPLMSEIAAFSDYKLKILGIAPSIPVLITVVHQDIEIGDIVREAHLQAKARADVVIYPKSKTIEIRYFEMG